MPANETCQSCGTAISTAFARVFGDNNDDAHACLSCTPTAALKAGAAVAPTRDGTPLVYRPGYDDPQPATPTDTSPPPSADEEVVHLEDLRHRDHPRGTRDDSFSHTDSEFEALVAE
ncbi:DUF7563 family protein [Halobacterium salinarum]|uniref:DUF7563 family protein n=1 Tax=Halobacterium salinarum TaxID=2242 RepID=UPI002555194B|nr:hypothetical protein [Halobacterium salinarum]MDL0126609.1 hypothetical protein [Halobacterium salinarum]